MAPSHVPLPTCGTRSSGPSCGNPKQVPTASPQPLCDVQVIIPDYVAHHDVQAGDTLYQLAAQKLGDAGLWMDLAQLNNICSPPHLQVGQRLIMPDFGRYDVTVAYMHTEMITNCGSSEVAGIQQAHQRANNLNAEARRYYADAADDEWYQFLATSAKISAANDLSQASTLARLEAKTRWFLQVRAGGPWDHKPILRNMYTQMSNPRGSYGHMSRAFHFPVRGDVFNEYYYDIWSNIHYGFVGMCAGFDAKTLQSAADLGLPGFGDNDQGDFISTQIGIDLWRAHGLSLSHEHIRQAIVSAGALFISARTREIAGGVPVDEATNVVIQNNDYK